MPSKVRLERPEDRFHRTIEASDEATSKCQSNKVRTKRPPSVKATRFDMKQGIASPPLLELHDSKEIPKNGLIAAPCHRVRGVYKMPHRYCLAMHPMVLRNKVSFKNWPRNAQQAANHASYQGYGFSRAPRAFQVQRGLKCRSTRSWLYCSVKDRTYLQCSVSLKPSKESLSAKLRLCSRPRTGFLQGLKDLFSPQGLCCIATASIKNWPQSIQVVDWESIHSY